MKHLYIGILLNIPCLFALPLRRPFTRLSGQFFVAFAMLSGTLWLSGPVRWREWRMRTPERAVVTR